MKVVLPLSTIELVEMPVKSNQVLILVFLILLVPQALSADQVIKHEGRVVKVIDGDSITLLVNSNSQFKIRLAEIDTPERGQPYWRVCMANWYA